MRLAVHSDRSRPVHVRVAPQQSLTSLVQRLRRAGLQVVEDKDCAPGFAYLLEGEPA